MAEGLKRGLRVYAKLSTDAYMRDRSVKALQYGCLMILGYYGSKLSTNAQTKLRATRGAASTSRKFFWLLKSINNLNALVKMVGTYKLDKDQGFANLFDILEQIGLFSYYLFENLTLVARLNLVSFKESEVERATTRSWFYGDLACFIARLVRLILHLKTLQQERLNAATTAITAVAAGPSASLKLSGGGRGIISKGEEEEEEEEEEENTGKEERERERETERRRNRHRMTLDLTLGAINAALELVVSIKYMGYFPLLLGYSYKRLPAQVIANGTTSSSTTTNSSSTSSTSTNSNTSPSDVCLVVAEKVPRDMGDGLTGAVGMASALLAIVRALLVVTRD